MAAAQLCAIGSRPGNGEAAISTRLPDNNMQNSGTGVQVLYKCSTHLLLFVMLTQLA